MPVDLANHCTRDDLWLRIHNSVYDITHYLSQHPGGESVLLDRAGCDATADFEDVGHSPAAIKTLSQYKVGELEDVRKVRGSNPKISSQSQDGSSLVSVRIYWVFAIILFAVVLNGMLIFFM